MVIVIAIMVGAAFIYHAYRLLILVYALFDHSSIPSVPMKLDASIVDIDREKVTLPRIHERIRTRVCFSDGFVYTTHRTIVDNNVFHSGLYIDEELSALILSKANLAHTKWYYKQKRKLDMKSLSR